MKLSMLFIALLLMPGSRCTRFNSLWIYSDGALHLQPSLASLWVPAMVLFPLRPASPPLAGSSCDS